MRPHFFTVSPLAGAALFTLFATFALAEPRHGIAMYGDPALPPDFVSLPYANPDAPKGGSYAEAEIGTFDSVNPFILKGRAPWLLGPLVFESLMGRSIDEPFTLYGLLAETIETGPNREWVEFTLRPEAAFSDGSPVTVEDVIWSYETLGTVGNPRYLGFWSKVAKIEPTGPRSLRITFNEDNPELALLAGMRPVLKKAQWDGADFADSTLAITPVGSAPYVIDAVDPGRFVRLRRNPDYWGKDLNFRRGTHNFDTVTLEFFGDAAAAFEAFKAGELSMNREGNAELWETHYDFPAIARGEMVKSEIAHQRPSGIKGLVMNTRRPVFADWRVREAMILAFNFEYINEAITGGRQTRITSYYSNSPLAMQPGLATGKVRALLEPFAADLPPGALEGYEMPVGDGTLRNRGNLKRAIDLMAEAGWTVTDGALRNGAGDPFRFDVLLLQSSTEDQSIMDIYLRALERLGAEVTITVMDPAAYRERVKMLDFDMTSFQRSLSLSPGNEQRLYWGSAEADQPESRNLMGVKSAAVDAMIDAILAAPSQEDFIAAARALDRVLTAGRYVIPFYQSKVARVAHKSNIHHPEHLPIYGDWLGYMPDVWWTEE